MSFTFEVVMKLDALPSAETETMNSQLHAKQTNKKTCFSLWSFSLQAADTGHVLQC